jgi:glycosyltransferase involved in cell wall biosynthesis
VIHNRLPTPGETRILAEALYQLLRLTGASRLVQVVSLPFWLDATLRIRDLVGSPIVYDCHDHLGGFSRLGRELVEREAEALRRCDLAVFSSQALMDAKTAELPELLAKSRLIRNAADSGGSIEPGVPRQADRGPRPAKVIGYVGALDHWFDIEAVREAARRRPEWDFVLIGRVEQPAIWDLGRLPNVKLVGEIPQSQLGARIAGFDVGLIPFLVNELTLGANPIKLYEYFSHGLPVVSSDLPEVRMFGDLVCISNSPSDFAAKVEIAASEQDEPARQRRIAIAGRETWANRALEFRSVFRELWLRLPSDTAGHGR